MADLEVVVVPAERPGDPGRIISVLASIHVRRYLNHLIEQEEARALDPARTGIHGKDKEALTLSYPSPKPIP